MSTVTWERFQIDAGRTGRFRSTLAARRMLLVLDDAADAAQVRAVLRSAPECGVLLTSRQVLSSIPNARHHRLEPLSGPEGLRLLTELVGRNRIAADPVAARAVVRLTDGLPLALVTAAARLAARPRWPVAELARRLDELSDDQGGIRAGSPAATARTPSREAICATSPSGSWSVCWPGSSPSRRPRQPVRRPPRRVVPTSPPRPCRQGLGPAQAKTLQAQVDKEIAANDGTQIAANEIEWKDGGASTVLALPGQEKPVSLRHGVDPRVPACSYYHMCLYSDWGTAGYVMDDLYYCRDYHTAGYWKSCHNNQTAGTQAAFKNISRVIIDWSQAAPSWANYDSLYVHCVKPC